jgi:outer membrane protein assembly factor BamD
LFRPGRPAAAGLSVGRLPYLCAMRLLKAPWAFLLALLLLASCSRFNRLLKSTDHELKYKEAVRYYEAEKYYHALQLLEELISVYKGSQRAEEVYYYYAKAYYGSGEFLTAAYHLSNFARTFPSSRYAEETQYLNAYCYYLDSPVHSLDQQSTLDAIDQFQLFVNRYPESERVAECNRLIDELRLKLETKAFNNARLYFKMSEYRAATIAFENVIRDFPATTYKEECLFLSVKSAHAYAGQSIAEKQKERYRLAIEQYYKLIEAFPQSRYLREAEKLFLDAGQKVEDLEAGKSVTLRP